MTINLGNHDHVIRLITAYAWMKDALPNDDQCLVDSFQTIYSNQSTRPELINEFVNLSSKFLELKPWLISKSCFYEVYKACLGCLEQKRNKEMENQCIELMRYIFESNYLKNYNSI